MGYVLPVQMDAYTQYANRTISEKQRLKLDPVIRPTFYRVDPQLSWEEIHKNTQHNQFNRKREKQASGISDKLLADITGKGRFFHESI
ncbi:MAG: hypothetical protein U9Q88_18625 [Bacillota bacterium]|jgi:hypothetical protein|uniref:hypothetical protein n=1 Tax=Bacillus sp. RO2 TaxID=2723913 RepID=UPI00145FA4A1|nr:hypothetical protein [Bacillus sp. RO2]MEA3322011.1 hypothetical protein [Bacillota bacterium]NMH75447.1 hypothetical protein [Bacillus sp. RO2]